MPLDLSRPENSVKKPPRLRPGAHIRLLSLSAPFAAICPGRFKRACEHLAALGFRVSLAPTTTQRFAHMAGRPEDRARDFVNAWLDPNVDAILSVIGGHSTHQILEYLPFGDLDNPKLLIGYSDTTSLMMALYARCQHVTFQGPALMPQFGEFGGVPPATYKSFVEATQSDLDVRPLSSPGQIIEERLRWDTEDVRPRQISRRETRRCLRDGRARGRLVVANMGTLLLLAGTSYFPDCTGAILVLEEDESESPQSIDRYLTQFRHLGVFDKIAGLVIGRLPHEVEMTDDVLDEMLLRTTKGSGYPILTGFEVGHVDPALTLPIGVLAELDARQLSLTQLERATTG